MVQYKTNLRSWVARMDQCKGRNLRYNTSEVSQVFSKSPTCVATSILAPIPNSALALCGMDAEVLYNPRQRLPSRHGRHHLFQDFVAPMSPFLHRDCPAGRLPLFAVPPDRPEYLLHSIGPRRSDYSPY